MTDKTIVWVDTSDGPRDPDGADECAVYLFDTYDEARAWVDNEAAKSPDWVNFRMTYVRTDHVRAYYGPRQWTDTRGTRTL